MTHHPIVIMPIDIMPIVIMSIIILCLLCMSDLTIALSFVRFSILCVIDHENPSRDPSRDPSHDHLSCDLCLC